jgi:acyl-CoA thioesterase-1
MLGARAVVLVGLLLSSPLAAKAQNRLDLSTVASLALSAVSYSESCRSTNASSPGAATGALPALYRAARERRSIRILAIGSSSTVGLGASAPAKAYVPLLKAKLQGVLAGLQVNVIGRGVSGERAQGAADRMKAEVERIQPDVVVWQVGTNDAIARVGIDSVKACVARTLSWILSQGIDVLVVNPQYGQALARDAHYERTVRALTQVAEAMRVPLIDRYDRMRGLQLARGDTYYLSSDSLHPNDNGHRCMAEQLAAVLIAGLVKAAAEQSTPETADFY